MDLTRTSPQSQRLRGRPRPSCLTASYKVIVAASPPQPARTLECTRVNQTLTTNRNFAYDRFEVLRRGACPTSRGSVPIGALKDGGR
jgi:hypothetical protein